MSVEEKWQANRDKVAFAKSFPGWINDWTEVQGKTLERVIPLNESKMSVAIFSGGHFGILPGGYIEPAALIKALDAVRPWLESVHPKAYQTLDDLTAQDKELKRKTRLEKLLSAVKNNYPDMPELKDELKKLLDELP
ncbi:MAG TPA: hypothetical protein VGB26_05035 [Nitrospiria bacterium]|jgi:hypothetical protein